MDQHLHGRVGGNSGSRKSSRGLTKKTTGGRESTEKRGEKEKSFGGNKHSLRGGEEEFAVPGGGSGSEDGSK